MKTRIRALVGFWQGLAGSGRSYNKSGTWSSNVNRQKTDNNDFVARDLFTRYNAAVSYVAPPPSYEECLHDVPPDYTTTDALANASLEHDGDLRATEQKLGWRPPQGEQWRFREGDVKVDFGDIENIRTHGKKKKKQASNNFWADSDNEKEKEGAAGGAGGDDNGEGGDAGGGRDAGGAGGDPPGGGAGGDDGDDFWNAAGGGKKNKKKKKSVRLISERAMRHANNMCRKNAWEEFEEEEKKLQEEEKKLAEEEAAANGDTAAAAGEADPVDGLCSEIDESCIG